MRLLLLSSVALATLAGAAFAADLPSQKEAPAPVYVAPPPVFTWTGFYIGADIGGGWANQSANSTLGSLSGNGSGVVGGGRVGYDYQINQFVLGVEGDFYGTSIDNTRYFPLADTTVKSSQDWLASVNGRLGYAVDHFLIYAIGGVAWTQGSSTFTAGTILGPRVVLAGFPNSVGVSHSFTGYDVGGGVEYAFTNNWIGRIEYRYYDFGNWNYSGNYWLPRSRTGLNDNVVTVGLSYKFNALEPIVAKY